MVRWTTDTQSGHSADWHVFESDSICKEQAI